MLAIITLCAVLGLVSSQTFTANSCGHRPLKPNDEDYDKIVGGVESLRGDWPWSCSMRFNGNHICGGSLIKENWVVTAAHCVSATAQAASYTWACGLHHRTISDPWTQIYTTLRIIRHPNYNSRLIQNDIALFELRQSAVHNNYILPACFPAATDTFASQQSVAIGWGSVVSGGGSSPVHREVSMPVLTDARCEERFDGVNNMIDPPTQVCAGEVGGNKDTCQGDSGGALNVKKSDGLWYVIGLTSWGYGCGDGGVYARTSGYRAWVVSHTGPLPTGTN